MLVKMGSQLDKSLDSLVAQVEKMTAAYHMRPDLFPSNDEAVQKLQFIAANSYKLSKLVVENKAKIAAGSTVIVGVDKRVGTCIGFGSSEDDKTTIKVAVSFTDPPKVENSELFLFSSVEKFSATGDA